MLKSIWIFILISIIANFVGAMNKANQKKKPMPKTANKTRQADYGYGNNKVMPEVKENYGNSLEYNTGTISPEVNYYENTGFSYETKESAPVPNEPVIDTEEEFDVKLSELQHAIVMTEILDKPLALRKK